jgi:hypothetical protein
VLSPTVEEHAQQDQCATQSETSHFKGNSKASGSPNKEHRPSPNVSKETTATPESLCSVSKGKSTAIHAQPIDHLKYMEPSLSLAKGIPLEVPRGRRSPDKEIVVHVEEEMATERAKTGFPPWSDGSALGSPAEKPVRILVKPISPLPAAQNGIRSIGPVAWAKKSLSSKQSRESEETVAPTSSQRKPKVLIFRASSRESEIEDPKDHRRLGGSESSMQIKVPNRSPRKVSRSLYDDPQWRKKLLELDFEKKFPNRDPLETISQEDDLASLAELAQALDFADDQDGTSSESKTEGVKQETPYTPTSRKYTTANGWRGEASRLEKTGHNSRVAQVLGPAMNDPTTQGEKTMNEKLNLFKPDLKPQAVSADTRVAYPPTPKRMPASTNPATPRSQTYQQRKSVEINSTNLPGSASGKFSALVAKFNNPGSQNTPDRSHSRSRKKTLTMFLAEDDQKRNEPLKEGLVAPYTTNPPSPAKSQKSGKSDNTSQSLRSPLTKPDTEGTPCSNRGIPPARRDSILSRRARKSPEDLDAATPKQAASTSRKSSPVICRKTPCPLEDKSATELSPPNDDLERLSLAQKTIEEADEESKAKLPSTTGPSNECQLEQATIAGMENPSSKDSPVLSEGVTVPPSMASNEVPIFDGSNGALNIKKFPISFHATKAELICAKSSPGLLDTASFVHPDSPLRDTFMTSNPVSPAGSPPPPGRSNSVLYAQIRTLQKQLSSKTEEVRQLKKQLDARGSLDIGTLSEQLREAKKEILILKTRAEVAEKQIEIFTKLPSRNYSRQSSKDLSTKSPQVLTRASTGYAGEAADMAARIRKALRGIDGAESPAQWSSEESSHTVIRELIREQK